MVGQVALEDDLAGQIGAACSPRDLGEQLKRALGGSEVGKAQAHVGVHDADQSHLGKVVPFGDHLRPHQDVDVARLEARQRSREGSPSREGVTIHPGHSRLGKRRAHRFGHLLRTEARQLQVDAATGRALAGGLDLCPQ